MKQFIIVGSDCGEMVFWSNKDGWGDIKTATFFMEDELKTLNYPRNSDAVLWIEPDTKPRLQGLDTLGLN